MFNNEVDYIKEPVEEIVKKIQDSKRNTILAGPKNSGKTLIINKLIENKKDDEEYFFVKNCLEYAANDLNEEELIQLFEWHIFNFVYGKLKQIIQSNIKRLNESENKEVVISKLRKLSSKEEELNTLLHDRERTINGFYNYINNRSLNCEDLRFFEFGEISKRALDFLRDENLLVNAVFDRFENSQKELVQRMILRYSGLFERTIIVADENVLREDEKNFENIGWDVVKTEYTKDKEFVRKYLDFRFNQELKRIKTLEAKKGYDTKSDDYSFFALINITMFMSDDDINRIVEIGNGDLKLANSFVSMIIDKLRYRKTDDWRNEKNLFSDIVSSAINNFISLNNFEANSYPVKKISLF